MTTRSYALFCVGATVWGLLAAEISVAQDFEIVRLDLGSDPEWRPRARDRRGQLR